MGRDIMDHHFLGPRMADKLVLSLIVMSLYYAVGANQAPSNVNNLTAVLFLWTILPGYAAASYMPTIVLERPLFVRSATVPAFCRHGTACIAFHVCLWCHVPVPKQ